MASNSRTPFFNLSGFSWKGAFVGAVSTFLVPAALAQELTDSEVKLTPEQKTSISSVLSKGRQQFIENKGQWSGEGEFVARTKGLDFWVTKTGLVMDYYQVVGQNRREGHAIGLDFIGSGKAFLQGENPDKAVMDYIGPDGTVQTRAFDGVTMSGLYPRISAKHYMEEGRPRYDLIVSPGGDPSKIRMRFKGVDHIDVSNDEISFDTSFGTLKHKDLFAYQWVGGKKREVAADFKKNSDGTIGFKLGAYDNSKSLVIDPLVYGSYVGGDDGMDEVHAVGSDPDGGVYITGSTQAPSFPNNFGPYGFNLGGIEDAFIMHLAGDVYERVYSAYLGGNGDDSGNFLAVDPFGHVWIMGTTQSSNFPGNVSGQNGHFIIRFARTGLVAPTLNPNPTKVFMFGQGIGVTAHHFKIVENEEPSLTSPVVMVIVGTTSDQIPQITRNSPSGASGFFFKFQFNGSFSVDSSASQYITGAVPTTATGLDLDKDGNIFVAGTVNGFGTVDTAAEPNVFFTTQTNPAGNLRDGRLLRGSDAYVRKYSPTGNLIYSVLLGGNGQDAGVGVAVDTIGNAHVTGVSRSFNFPRTRDVFGEVFTSSSNIFVSKLNPDASDLLFSTHMRAGGIFSISGIEVDQRGLIFLTGIVGAASFFDPVDDPDPNVPEATVNAGSVPTTGDALKGAFTFTAAPDIPSTDGFVLVLNNSGTALIFGSYIGAILDDVVFAPFVDKFGDVWISGYTDTYREYVRVSSGGQPTIFRTRVNLPANHITNTAWRPNPDPNSGLGGPGTTTVFPVLYGAPSEIPFFISTANDRDGFVLRYRVDVTAVADVTFNRTSAPGGLGATVTGTVTLSQAAPAGGTDVTLTLSNINAASFAAGNPTSTRSLTVAQGQTTATFTVFTLPVSDTTPVTIRAEAEGNFRAGTFSVVPWLQQLSITPNTVVGGNPTIGRVRLIDNAPAGGVNVVITDNSELTTVANVTVPGGTSTVTFNIGTAGVTSNATVNVNASLLGVGKTASVTLTPSTLNTLTFTPPQITAGGTTTGTIKLNGKAGPTGFPVTLSINGNPPGYVFTPTTVTFAPNSDTATFTLKTPFETADVARLITATRSAATGYPASSVSATLFLVASNLSSFNIAPTAVDSGGTATGNVTISAPALAGGALVNIAVVGPNPGLVINNGNPVIVPQGETNFEFPIKTPGVLVDTTVTLSAARGGAPVFANLLIRKLAFDMNLSVANVAGGNPVTGTITLASSFTNDLVVSLSSSNTSAATVPATVTVPAGETSVEFIVQTNNVPADLSVNISATVGTSTVTRSLQISAAKIKRIIFTPSTVRGGDSTRCTIEYDAPVAAGVTLTIQVSNSMAVKIPTTVTLPAGKSSITFTVVTRRVSVSQNVNVTAQAAAGDSVNTALRVTSR